MDSAVGAFLGSLTLAEPLGGGSKAVVWSLVASEGKRATEDAAVCNENLHGLALKGVDDEAVVELSFDGDLLLLSIV